MTRSTWAEVPITVRRALEEALQTPAPADMPTFREFQRREATAALGWLRRRWA